MAIFDPVEQRLCVRIVYDGAGGAGKTTNLRSLCSLFATQRTTEMFSPGEADGRTLYFDWVQILAGAICGYPLMCQIISVPGQAVLTPRRRHLLSTADVVVYVCDSDPAGLERAREGLALLDTLGRDIPLLVQANKQDRPHALSGKRVLAALGREASVVEAIATDGVGVVDTFVSAVRTVSRKMQEDNEAGRLQLDVGRAPVAADVLERLQRAELDPAWAAEMFLEEAHSAFLIEGGFERQREPAPVRHDTLVFPRSDVETGFIWPAHTGRLALDELAPFHDTDLELDASGVCEVVLGDRRLRTTEAHRFDDREEARQALVRAARERTQLDPKLATGTVLVLQAGRDGALWLWTIMKDAPRLPEVVGAIEDRRVWLQAYAAAVVDVLRAGIQHGFKVDLTPECFGVVGTDLHYFGEVGSGSESDTPNVVSALDAVARLGWESDVFLEEFERRTAYRGVMSTSSVPPAYA